MDLEWASVWRAKCEEFHTDMKELGGSVGARDQANSQKMDLEWASVWKATCKEFRRKMKDFGVSVLC